MLGEKFYSSVSVGDRVVVRVEANRHAQGRFALSVHKEGTADVAGRIGKEVSELLSPLKKSNSDGQLANWPMLHCWRTATRTSGRFLSRIPSTCRRARLEG